MNCQRWELTAPYEDQTLSITADTAAGSDGSCCSRWAPGRRHPAESVQQARDTQHATYTCQQDVQQPRGTQHATYTCAEDVQQKRVTQKNYLHMCRKCVAETRQNTS